MRTAEESDWRLHAIFGIPFVDQLNPLHVWTDGITLIVKVCNPEQILLHNHGSRQACEEQDETLLTRAVSRLTYRARYRPSGDVIDVLHI
jgi:hypothetical protein